VLWNTPLHHVWDALSHLQRFAEVAEIHRGIEYKDNVSKFISDQPKSGSAPALVNVQKKFEPYSINSFKYLNTDPELMRRKAQDRPWDTPKVIANAARLSRGPWTIAGAVDEQGLLCYQNFHGIWPIAHVPLDIIAALLNGPVANAFVSTHRTSRHNEKRVIEQIPIPEFTTSRVQSIVSLVDAYRSYRQQWFIQPERSDYFERLCRELMWQIDAEVLAAYDLPPRLERELLDYFAGHQRPGPVKFDRYYPADFRPAVPWRDYISEEFRSSTARRTLERLPVLHDPIISDMVEELD